MVHDKAIVGTGLQGLVGSRITELLQQTYTCTNISRSTGVDITNASQIDDAIRSTTASLVLHMAAKTDVEGCEKEKHLGKESEAWQINVLGTQHVADACVKYQKKLIYISTDFVFDGEKESYTEEDVPNPVNWYATTKYEGEKIVQSRNIPWVIMRIAYPYRAQFAKFDFVRAIYARLAQKQTVQGVTDHIFTPTFIDDIALALDAIIRSNLEGIIHVVGGSSLTPYDAAQHIARTFGFEQSRILPTTREQFFANRAKRPFRLAIKNDKIKQFGVRMKTFEEGLTQVKSQIQNAK